MKRLIRRRSQKKLYRKIVLFLLHKNQLMHDLYIFIYIFVHIIYLFRFLYESLSLFCARATFLLIL